MKKIAIEVNKLTKSFKNGNKKLIAVNDVSFRIYCGSLAVIVGKSGSGKSTLLYQLGLLDYPSSGEILINGTNVIKLSEAERTKFRLAKLGYVFQDYALMPTLSAVENVLLPLLMIGLSNSNAKKKALDALDRVGLKNRANNLPSQLSGGEQQRVSIARAICNNPQILFADEPTANLDSETTKMILELLKQLNNDGQTIVMVTHEIDYANFAESVIKLSDGRIIK